MPEYRRFISYFYEYIDGKKQRNTGFAKVELRNGVWRLLFRLTVSVQLGSPVEVFGFMREGEKLTGLPMGTMRAAREMTEEWAYRADEPVWAGKYGLSDISGLWIQSGDGRCFATVWDDEPVDPAQFAKYEAQDEKQAKARKDTSGQAEVRESALEQAEVGETEPGQAEMREEAPEQPEVRAGVPEQTEAGETVPERVEVKAGVLEQPGVRGDSSEQAEVKAGVLEQSEVGEDSPEQTEVKTGMLEQSEVREEAPEQLEVKAGVPEHPEGGETVPKQPETRKDMPERAGETEERTSLSEDRGNAKQPVGSGKFSELSGNNNASVPDNKSPEDDRLWRDLYRKRAGFQPFSDQEISSCIRVVPGDIVVLQNAHWRTGRNNFLLHGYHNYRHLLIGRNSDGGYVLGVPGIMNPQEKYMASMFGFPNFKYADDQESGTSFGYWYRFLEREDR